MERRPGFDRLQVVDSHVLVEDRLPQDLPSSRVSVVLVDEISPCDYELPLVFSVDVILHLEKVGLLQRAVLVFYQDVQIDVVHVDVIVLQIVFLPAQNHNFGVVDGHSREVVLWLQDPHVELDIFPVGGHPHLREQDPLEGRLRMVDVPVAAEGVQVLAIKLAEANAVPLFVQHRNFFEPVVLDNVSNSRRGRRVVDLELAADEVDHAIVRLAAEEHAALV